MKELMLKDQTFGGGWWTMVWESSSIHLEHPNGEKYFLQMPGHSLREPPKVGTKNGSGRHLLPGHYIRFMDNGVEKVIAFTEEEQLAVYPASAPILRDSHTG